jgi:hypothetical protein
MDRVGLIHRPLMTCLDDENASVTFIKKSAINNPSRERIGHAIELAWS